MGMPGRLQPRVILNSSRSSLVDLVPEWEELAARAVEPNVFYEPWALLPALTQYSRGRTVDLLLCFFHDEGAGQARLVGLFPLQWRRRFRGLPIPCLAAWSHPHCYLTTPLVQSGFEQACWAHLLDWMAADPEFGAPLIELETMAGDGPVFRGLSECLSRRESFMHVRELYDRPMIRLGRDGEEYLQERVGSNHRQNYRRKRRRLAEMGRLELCKLGPRDDVDLAMDEFLQLEASGWKGREGTALACNDVDRVFFKMLSREAHQRGCLELLTLRLDGRAVAALHILRPLASAHSGDGTAYSLKTAYDEGLEKVSPGMILEFETILEVHRSRTCQWMDSCSIKDTPLAQIWRDQRRIADVVCPSSRPGVMVLKAMEVLRTGIRMCRFRRGSKPRDSGERTPAPTPAAGLARSDPA